MTVKSDAIGSNMTQKKIEYFREILHVGYIENDSRLEGYLKTKSEKKILFRDYYMYHEGNIICYIVEYFSPYIFENLLLS